MFSSINKFRGEDSRLAANFGIFVLIFSFLIGSTSYAYKIFSQGGASYQTGDWLINYHGGFVRRGFFGNLFLNLFSKLSFEMWILFIIQVLLYGFIFTFFIFHLYRSKSNWLLTILICSPAGISFSGWDIHAFGRKEALGYVVLILLALRISKRENMITSMSLLISAILLYSAGIFSWEPLVFLIPSVIFLVSKGFSEKHTNNLKYLVYFVFFSIGFLGLALSIRYRGDIAQANSICTSIRDAGLTGKELCFGAVEAIGWTSSFTIGKVQSSFPLYFWYLPLFIAALIPLTFSQIIHKSRKIVLVIFLCLLPLYFVVNDYGRWFSMFYTSFLIVLIATKRIPTESSNRLFSSRFGIPFLTTWGIPHWADPNFAFPIVGAIATPLRILLHFIKVG